MNDLAAENAQLRALVKLFIDCAPFGEWCRYCDTHLGGGGAHNKRCPIPAAKEALSAGTEVLW